MLKLKCRFFTPLYLSRFVLALALQSLVAPCGAFCFRVLCSVMWASLGHVRDSKILQRLFGKHQLLGEANDAPDGIRWTCMVTSFFCSSQAVNYIEISFLNEKLKTCSLSASDAESVDPMSALHAVTSACPGVKPTRQTNINQQRVVCFGGAVKTIPMEMGQGQKTKSLARWCWQATSQVRCLKNSS